MSYAQERSSSGESLLMAATTTFCPFLKRLAY